MNHYPHHIGDFNNATRHLTFVERALYRELLDLYYDTEHPLIADETKLARRVLAHTDEQREALQSVLAEFFELREDGWHNARCDAEIDAYQQKKEQASNAGRASGAKRKGRAPDEVALSGEVASAHAGAGDAAPSGSTDVERALNGRATNQNQNQNQNHIHPPNPPGGGAGDAMAIAQKLAGSFPVHRRTKLAMVARCITELEGEGIAASVLLDAAAKQSSTLGREDGKACPDVLSWLRRRRWLDTAAMADAPPADWRATRSATEAMGKSVGLPPYEGSGYRLLSDYCAEIERRLTADEVPA